CCSKCTQLPLRPAWAETIDYTCNSHGNFLTEIQSGPSRSEHPQCPRRSQRARYYSRLALHLARRASGTWPSLPPRGYNVCASSMDREVVSAINGCNTTQDGSSLCSAFKRHELSVGWGT